MAARSNDIQATHQWQHDPFERKGSRYRILKFIGPLPKWFRNHMILGMEECIHATRRILMEAGRLQPISP